MQAGNDFTLASVETGQSHDITWNAHNHHRQSSSQEVGSSISGGGAVSIQAQNDIQARAAQINAQGALSLQATDGNITIEAGQSSQSLAESQRSVNRGTFSRTTTTRTSNSQSTTAQASEIRGQSVTVLGQNVVSIGTQFEAQGGVLHIEGADTTLLYAAQDSHRSESHTTTQRSTFGVTTGRSDTSSRAQSTSAVRTELISDQAVRIGVGERADLLGASVSAPQIDFVRSQNAAPNAAGQLHLGAAIEQDSASTHTSSTTLGLWQKQQGSGHERSSGQMTELSGSVSIDPSIRLSIELPREVNSNSPTSAPSLQAQIQQLASQNPGLAYLSQLQDNPAVKWSELELAQREWDYSQQGLTGAGAALVSLAVAWATGGMGAGLVGSATTSAASTAAMNAGFTTLAAQASVSLINNGGDIGRTLKDLGSSDSLKTLVASMATAGAVSSLGSHMHIGDKPLGSITVNDGFTANLGKAVVNNLTSATLNSALTGASLEDSIQTALVSAAISAGAGQVANSIGDLTIDGLNPTLSPAGAALAHTLAGCIAGAVGQGGSSGCTAGGLGALVGELAAQWFDPEGIKPQTEVLGFAQLMGGVAGALSGDGSAASVNTAANTAANAVQNNYLQTRELSFALDQLRQCSGEPQCDQIAHQLERSLSQGGWQRNAGVLKDRCLGPNPMSCANDIQDMSAALQLLQDPQSRQLLGERAATALIERQLRDMAITMVMIEQGQVKFDNNKAMLDAMYGATKTAIELCAVVPLAGPCRVADMGLTAAEIGVSFAKGDYSEGATQLISEGAAQVVGDGVSKSLSSKWWGNIYGYLTGKAVEAAPQILECPTCEPKL